jgi:large subunit ribosomal protein L25
MAAKAKAKAEQLTLTVTKRAVQGKRPVRRLRAEGVVPGVVYGRRASPVAIAVNARELTRVLRGKAGEHALVSLKIEGAEAGTLPALVKAVQHDPVDGRVVHVDFHTIELTEHIKVKIPVLLKGEPVGVKQEGGILEHFLREVEVSCLPTEIPEGVEFDVSALSIGTTVHVRDLTAPGRSKILSDPGGVIASVQQPKVEAPPEEAPAVTEPEVIREKKPEEAEAPEAAEPGEGKKEGKAEK